MSAPIIVSTPIQYIREYVGALDKDSVFATTAERVAYLTNARRYGGQLVVDLELNGVYFLNTARTAWVPVIVNNKVTMTFTGDDVYELPEGFLVDKIIITPTVTDTIKVGTVVEGDDIMLEEEIIANDDKCIDYTLISRTGTKDIHFTGITASCLVTIYLRLL